VSDMLLVKWSVNVGDMLARNNHWRKEVTDLYRKWFVFALLING